MGFIKDLSILTSKERKPYLPKREDWIDCRKCGSDNLIYEKIIGYGEITGIVYHYKVRCKNCRTSYHVKRNNYVFERVKDKPWIKSKSYKNKFN